MISITCTNCRQTLEMDEAFAGGVCRCQYCGTIQTVPSHLKGQSNGAAAAPAAAASVGGHRGGAASKSLYRGAAATAAPSSGLDDLANAVTSSGLSSSGLRHRTATGAASGAVGYHRPQPANPNKQLVLLGAAGVIVVLLGVIGFLAFRGGGDKPAPSNTTTAGGGKADPGAVATPTEVTPAGITGPHFCGISLAGAGKVVYVVDRGNSGERFFDPLKYAIGESIKSLGPSTQFQVVFWKRTADTSTTMSEMSYPDGKLAGASAEQADAFLRRFADLTASGATAIDGAIQEAARHKPDAIVIATAKADYTMEGVEAAVDKARAGSNVKIHTASLGATGGSQTLKSIAAKTGGQYAEVSERQLREQ